MAYTIWSKGPAKIPTVFLHSFVDNGQSVWEACQQLHCPDFHLVAIHDIDFDAALTPWIAPGVRKGQPPFAGEAKNHLEYLANELLLSPDIKLLNGSDKNILAGYSLAGLFALWSAIHTDIFEYIACVSASFWYPEWIDFLSQQQLSANIKAVYCSLGNREHLTRHPLLSQIDTCTQQTVDWIAQQRIPVTFEWNPGSHFTQPDWRMAKAIHHLLTT